MKRTIVLVGDDLNLQRTRALMLSEWETTIIHSRDVEQAFTRKHYDLIIICQSVQESAAKEIIEQAKAFQPAAEFLAVESFDSVRRLGIPIYLADLNHPRAFINAVAMVLPPT